MNRIKVRLITILSFFALLFLALGIAFGAVAPLKAGAVTYSPSSVFASGTGGSVGASEAGENETSFVQFTMSDGGKTYFRRDLALKWYAAPVSQTEEGGDETPAAQAEAPLANPAETKYFSMKFAFPAVNFETFEISFESAEENISKDGKATNSLVFFFKDSALKVAVKNAGEQDVENKDIAEEDKLAIENATGDITVTLDEAGCNIGEFNVNVNGTKLTKKFTNIGGYYLEYRSSSSSTPNTPVTFAVKLPENAGTAATQFVHMKELNGQTFELENGRVTDNAVPVLVLNEKIYSFSLGQRYSLTHEAIDVCDDTVTVTRSYYMLKYKDEAPVKPNEETDDDYKTLTTSTYFMPTDDAGDGREHVSVRFKLSDGTTKDPFVYLTWYAAAGAVETVGEGENAFDYIVVDRTKEGPYYLTLSRDDTAKTNSVVNEEAVTRYQAALDEIVEKGLSAGSGAYIYLPSMRDLFASNDADYRNLRFSIYYYKESAAAGSSASSQTSLRYNGLRLEIDQMGLYKFRVLAADASGNNIKLWQDGELVDVTGSNIWDIDGIPEFTFRVSYGGATIEDPGEQSEGYRDSAYTFDNFEVIALSGYATDYTLYRFDTSKLPEGESAPTYSSFVSKIEDYMTEERYEGAITQIREYRDSVSKDDAAWDRTDNDYNWKPSSSLSFVPQTTGFYVLQVTVTDPNLPGHTATAYQAVNVRNPIDTIPGESKWLENNVTSVVLFCISGVLAIAIVVLFIVKPSDKKVEEVDLDKLKGKKKEKKNKK